MIKWQVVVTLMRLLCSIFCISPFLWIFCDCSELECVQCDNRIVSTDKTCSNCTGDYCFSIEYHYEHFSFKGQTGTYQGCMSYPTPLPTGCVFRENGNTVCICNQGDYCNQMNIKSVTRAMNYTTCLEESQGYDNEALKCNRSYCLRWSFDGPSFYINCFDVETELEQYDLGFMYSNMFLPLNSCFQFIESSYSSDKYYCTYSDNRKIKIKTKSHGKVKCYVPGPPKQRFTNTTCLGQFCYSSRNAADFGCISQFDIEGAVLKTGLYHITPFVAPFHICDSDFCNNETFYENDRYSFPTSYQWDAANSWNVWALMSYLGVLAVWRSI